MSRACRRVQSGQITLTRPPASRSTAQATAAGSRRSRAAAQTRQRSSAGSSVTRQCSHRKQVDGCGRMIGVTIHPVVAAKREEIAALCRELGVLRLDVFGSAVTDDFDVERSDVDVLVEFGPAAKGGIRTYFALKNGLERILGRPVDVVSGRAVRNPYFRNHVMTTREHFYAA
jgi:predicted nucleotidyltransferase